jgi:hypothetical protein
MKRAPLKEEVEPEKQGYIRDFQFYQMEPKGA